MAKQIFTTGQVLTAAQMTSLQETAMTGGPASTKTVSYVLVAADAGTRVAMNAAGSTTITVNTALFSAGDTVSIQNIGAGVCTVTAGTATVNTSGSLVLAQYQGGILYFTSASAAIFFQFATPASGDIEGVTAGVGISGGGTSGTVTITNDMATTITASGDIVVGTGSGTYDNLPIGTTGQVLTADTTVSPYKVKWAAPSAASFVGCAVYASSQTITKGIYNKLAYANEDFDTDAFHDNVTNNTRITIPSGKGGKYVVCGLIQFDTTTDAASVHLYKNGGLFNSLGIYEGTIQQGRNHAGNNNSGIGGTVTISLAATDYIELAYYSSGSGSGTCSNSRFSVAYLGA